MVLSIIVLAAREWRQPVLVDIAQAHLLQVVGVGGGGEACMLLVLQVLHVSHERVGGRRCPGVALHLQFRLRSSDGEVTSIVAGDGHWLGSLHAKLLPARDHLDAGLAIHVAWDASCATVLCLPGALERELLLPVQHEHGCALWLSLR